MMLTILNYRKIIGQRGVIDIYQILESENDYTISIQIRDRNITSILNRKRIPLSMGYTMTLIEAVAPNARISVPVDISKIKNMSSFIRFIINQL